MSIAVTAHANGSVKAVATAVSLTGVAIPAGSTIIVHATSSVTLTTGSISDSAGNPYLIATSTTTVPLHYIFYCANCLALTSGNSISVGTGATQTIAASSEFATGLYGTNPLDQAPTATSGSSTAPSITSGALAFANELVVASVAINGPSTDTFTQDSTNGAYATPPVRVGTTGGSDWTIAGGSLIVSATAAKTYASTLGTSEAWTALIATFKGAPPFVQSDWPLPRWADTRRREDSLAQTNRPLLIGQDKFFGANGQPPTYDWPLPRAADDRRRVDPNAQTNLGPLASLPPVLIPFTINYNWPPSRAADSGRRDDVMAQTNTPLLAAWFQANQTTRASLKAPRVLADDGRRIDLSAQSNPAFVVQSSKPSGPYDWPLPKAPFQLDRSSVFSSLPITPPAPTSPTLTFDWPNPRAGDDRRRVDPVAQMNTLLLSAWFQSNYKTRPPVFAAKWRLDTGARVDPDAQTNLTLLTIPARVLPFVQTDWPLPRAADTRRRDDVMAQTNNPLLALWFQQNYIVLPPVFGLPPPADSGRREDPNAQVNAPLLPPPSLNYTIRPPILAPRVLPDAGLRSDPNAQTNLEMMSAAIVKPFVQTDWPLPQRGPDPYRSWMSFSLPVLPPVGTIPFIINYDWPLPQRVREPYRSWMSSSLPVTPITGQIPFIPNYDWPLPQRGLDPYRSWAWASLPIVPPAAALAYIGNFDWPVPRGADDKRRVDSIAQSNLPLLNAGFLAVLTNYDWPLPPRGADDRRRVDPIAQSNLSMLYANVALRMAQFDWPLPRSADDKRRVDPLPQVFPPWWSLPLPFRQFDWPLPRGADDKRRIEAIAQANLQLLNASLLAALTNFDWPLPRTYPFIDRSWIQFRPNALVPNPPLPVGPYDWPLPVAPIYPTWLRTIIGTPPYIPLKGTVSFLDHWKWRVVALDGKLPPVFLGFMIPPNYYDIGSEVTISTAPPGFVTAAGLSVDPSDVILYVGNPTAVPAVQTFKYSQGQIVRDGVGLYHVDFTPNAHGWWECQWQGVGAVVASSAVVNFYVRPSFAIPG